MTDALRTVTCTLGLLAQSPAAPPPAVPQTDAPRPTFTPTAQRVPPAQAASQTQPARPAFIARTVQSEEISAAICAWSDVDGLILELSGGSRRRIPTEDLVSLTASADVADVSPTPRAGWRVQTTDGESLSAEIATGADNALTLSHARLGLLTVPLERLVAIERCGPSTASAPVSPDRPDDPAPDGDRVFLQNGDHSAGVIDALDSAGVSLQTGVRRQVLAWEVIRAIRFANPLPREAPPRPILLCATGEGDVIAGQSVNWVQAGLRLQRSDGRWVAIATDRIHTVTVRGGRWEWLADRSADEYESQPLFDLKWPLAANRNAAGGPLRCSGREASHGIGLHAAARAAWQLGGRYERFVAAVCIDDTGGAWSDADLEIRVDGRTAARIEHLRHAAAPHPLEVDLLGAQRLEVIVGYGASADVQDRVNLLDAALVRRPLAAAGR